MNEKTLVRSFPLQAFAGLFLITACAISPPPSPTPDPTSTIDPPAFSRWSGAYIGAQHIVIAAASDAQIRYTLDGSTPGVGQGTIYQTEVAVASTQTLRAVAIVGGRASAVSMAQYLIFLWQGTLAQPPASPELGWAYYDSSAGQTRFWDGTTWQTLAQDGSVGAQGLQGAPGANGADGADGVGIAWQGTLSAAPANPQVNWAYYDSVQAASFLWTGTQWQILAKDGVVGSQGVAGSDGATGASGADGVGIVWKGSFATPPANPELNWAYYDTQAKAAYLWTGSSWSLLVADGAKGDKGDKGDSGADGSSISWKGSSSLPPSNPQLNWAYYNSTDKVAYLFDGTDWQVMVKDGKDLTFTKTATPFFSLAGGTYGESKGVQILDTTEDATIYYTLDGTMPSSDLSGSTQQYSSSQVILIDRTRTLRAVAARAGLADSGIQTQVYALAVPKPFVLPAGGTYPSVQYLTVFAPLDGASYRYTTNGDTPDENLGVPLTDPVVVNASQVVKVVGYREGWTNSPVAVHTYTINAPSPEVVAEPAFTPEAATTFETSLQIQLASATLGSTIFYSLDDGATWTQGSSLQISGTTTLLARAQKSGMTTSSIATATFTKVAATADRVVQPSIVLNGGSGLEFGVSGTVTMSSPTAGADIWYTLNGATPVNNGTDPATPSYHYTGPITVTNSVSIGAKAFVGTSGLANDSLPGFVKFSLQSVADLALVTIDGGSYTRGSGFGAQVPGFKLAKYELTYRAWKTTYDWALDHGYTFAHAGTLGSSDQAPVYNVSFYDAIVWCNALSERYGLTPVYYSDGPMTAVFRNSSLSGGTGYYSKPASNGYRLPTPEEWEYAARNKGARPSDQYAGDADTWLSYKPYGTELVWKGSLASQPGSPAAGWLYTNTNDTKTYLYNGSVWNEIGTVSYGGTAVRWIGTSSFDVSPNGRTQNSMYFQTSSGKAYILDSGLARVSWNYLNTTGDGSNHHYPQKVAQWMPNELGLFDMTGNAGEWLHGTSASYAAYTNSHVQMGSGTDLWEYADQLSNKGLVGSAITNEVQWYVGFRLAKSY